MSSNESGHLPGGRDPQASPSREQYKELTDLTSELFLGDPIVMAQSRETTWSEQYAISLACKFLVWPTEDGGLKVLSVDEATHVREEQGEFERVSKVTGEPVEKRKQQFRERYARLDLEAKPPHGHAALSVNLFGNTEFRNYAIDTNEDEQEVQPDALLIAESTEAEARVKAAALLLDLIKKPDPDPNDIDMIQWLISEINSPVSAGDLYDALYVDGDDLLKDYMARGQQALEHGTTDYSQTRSLDRPGLTIAVKRGSPAQYGPNPGARLDISYTYPLPAESAFDKREGHLSYGGKNDFHHETDFYDIDKIKARIDAAKQKGIVPGYLLSEMAAKTAANGEVRDALQTSIASSKYSISAGGIQKVINMIASARDY